MIEAVRIAVGLEGVIVVRFGAAGDAVEVLRAIDQLECLVVVKARMSADGCEPRHHVQPEARAAAV
ncbi:MAG: hypothetical protein Q8S73_36135 [Deltaproteobacteria bacterium]|nr:hypothetical protein [Myxococcales bacterium]MDP3219588.1 hypothetical protein [Deltaproteobacteria bacterium]